MATETSKQSGKARVISVRFIRPVKMGGHWYTPGEEATLSAKIAKDFAKRGLVEKLSPESTETGKASSRGSRKVTDRSVGNRDRGPYEKPKDSRGVKK